MKTNEKILVGGAAAVAAYFLYKKMQTPTANNQALGPPLSTGIPTNTGIVLQPTPSGGIFMTQPFTPSVFEGKVNTSIGAYRAYGNCQCANGKQCVGRGDCSCCDRQIHTIILPFTKKQTPYSGQRSPVQSAQVGKCNYAYAM